VVVERSEKRGRARGGGGVAVQRAKFCVRGVEIQDSSSSPNSE
jgi:hypothetical protein